MLRDIALFNAAVIGTGIGILALKGQTTTTVEGSRTFRAGQTITATNSGEQTTVSAVFSEPS